ncbi:hypothetical protein L226DRAFT_607753 [Lentinus tigrinus ALCF2SS1-7]|uniref:uncharacterized protein n=1 Tax=Lentinus tigrinus ALCF2SS1-7 TaxID=1328758 RepID=UPI001165F6B5|nr:hypothetical protein L226DRAFT_607753 [Lentinus tigrinus ALCF2SS1-7]
MANPGNVARGLKAAVSNPNNSEETRADAQRRLDEMIDSGDATSTQAHNAQVKQGHKANINNPNTSEEAKERSRRAIEDLED